jgi:hypothetical protein
VRSPGLSRHTSPAASSGICIREIGGYAGADEGRRYLLAPAALSSASSVGLHGQRDAIFRVEAELSICVIIASWVESGCVHTCVVSREGKGQRGVGPMFYDFEVGGVSR